MNSVYTFLQTFETERMRAAPGSIRRRLIHLISQEDYKRYAEFRHNLAKVQAGRGVESDPKNWHDASMLDGYVLESWSYADAGLELHTINPYGAPWR